jgi:hypothetical protein
MPDENRPRIVTGKVRLAYVNVWEPIPNHKSGHGALKYSAQLIIPKTSRRTVAMILDGIDTAIEQGVAEGIWRTKPSMIQTRIPLKDGDFLRGDDPVYKGCWFLDATTTVKPKIVGLDLKPITDTSEIYSGVYARCVLTFRPYPNAGGGVSAVLGNIQKLADGTSTSQRTTDPCKDFSAPILEEAES